MVTLRPIADDLPGKRGEEPRERQHRGWRVERHWRESFVFHIRSSRVARGPHRRNSHDVGPTTPNLACTPRRYVYYAKVAHAIGRSIRNGCGHGDAGGNGQAERTATFGGPSFAERSCTSTGTATSMSPTPAKKKADQPRRHRDHTDGSPVTSQFRTATTPASSARRVVGSTHSATVDRGPEHPSAKRKWPRRRHHDRRLHRGRQGSGTAGTVASRRASPELRRRLHAGQNNSTIAK